jgi:hypothetical protein
MRTLFSSFRKQSQTKAPVIVVSGLPRSGTSMMMKMLAEGGLPLVTDQLRSADTDNPNGYFELEEVKQLPAGNAAWLSEAEGKVVKVISPLLEFLPPDHSYQVIFMERDMQEILASQRKMLANRNEPSKADDVAMEAEFRRHLSVLKPWLARQANMDVMYVSYNALMSDPQPLCERVVEFISAPLDVSRMLRVPKGELYRNRG